MEPPFELDRLLAFVRGHSTGIGSAIHGDRHWRTVAANGGRLAAETAAADRDVVFLFALFHDTMRENDHVDPGHGPRAAALVELATARGLLSLVEVRLQELVEACRLHADGLTSPSPTIGCCWDADRLDLPRVGIVPSAALLSTAAARRWEHPPTEPPDWRELVPRRPG